jgi:GNAT superfamily N-acetyltransferase
MHALARRNPAQNPQTATPAFKRWFGQSAVVDAKGKPLMVYHGSNAHAYSPGERIEVFSTSSRGGAFFSSDRSIAQQYGERIYPVYLRIENPLVLHAGGVGWTALRGGSRIEGSITPPMREALRLQEADRARKNQDVASLFAELADLDLEDAPAEMTRGSVARRSINLRGTSLSGHTLADLLDLDPSDTLETDDVVKAARRLGFDGVIIRAVQDSPTRGAGYNRLLSDIYAVFEPTQVKSATGNAGTFDPADPRITRNPRRRNPEDTTVLRLTGFRNKYGAAAEAFLRDLFDASYPNPLNPRERIFAGIEVTVEVSPLRGGVHLDEVRALRPGKGAGTKAMRFLAELADKHGVTMTLFPMPFGDQKMDTDDLVRFYRKHGFRFESEEGDEEEADIDMIRFPRHANPRGLDVRRGIPGTYRARFVAKGGRSRAYPAHAGAPWDKVMVRLASETTLSGGRMYDAVMQAAHEGRTSLPGKRGAVSVQRVTNPPKVSR